MGRGKHLKKRLDEQDKTDQALHDLVSEAVALVDENPEVADILKMAGDGDLPEAEALERLHGLVKMKAGPKLIGALDVLASRHNMELGYKPESGAKNLITLNPLLEAAIAERLQFDEDIPEIRSKENFRTAPVPSIQSNIQNPEMLAMCLESLRAERNQVIRANLEDKKQYAPDLIDEDAPHLADTQISGQRLLPGTHSGEMTVQRFEIAPQTRQMAVEVHDDAVDAMRFSGAEEARRTATGRLLSTTSGADSVAHALSQRLTWDELLPPFVSPHILPSPNSSFREFHSSADQRIPTSLNDQSWNPRFDVISHIYNQIVRPVRDELRGEIVTWALGAIEDVQPWQTYLLEEGDILLLRDPSQHTRFLWHENLVSAREERPETIYDPRIPEGQFFIARGEVFQFWTTEGSSQILHQQQAGERVRVWSCVVSGNLVATHPENLLRFSFG
jgi:hypothetical protein